MAGIFTSYHIMAKTLTRYELFELIWSRSRSKLAAEFGISDVAIGKHCARAHIPGPPPGYWARLQAGKGCLRPLLPMRLPGHPREVTLGQTHRHYHWSYEDDLNKPLQPPEFLEKLEDQVAAALKKIGRISALRDLSKPHLALRRVLEAEARRREKSADRSWSFDKPYFDDALYQRQLRIFNSIATALTPVMASQDVSVRDTWIEGLGTLHSLHLRLDFGGVAIALEIVEANDQRTARNSKGFKAVNATALRTGSDSDSLGMLAWVDQPHQKIESQLGVIVEALLSRAEQRLRKWAQESFELRTEQRIEIEKKREAAERAKEVESLKAIAAHRKQVRQQIVDLASQWRAAHDIRDMVTALSKHPDLSAQANPTFEAWRAQALEVADQLDPMKGPLHQVVQTSELLAREE